MNANNSSKLAFGHSCMREGPRSGIVKSALVHPTQCRHTNKEPGSVPSVWDCSTDALQNRAVLETHHQVDEHQVHEHM